MEMLRGRPTAIRFAVPTDLASATFEVYHGDTKIGDFYDAVVSSGYAYATPPWLAVANEGTIKIVIKFIVDSTVVTETKYVDVVRTYLEIEEIKTMMGTSSDAEALAAEASARYIINAHCGQNFGKTSQTLKVGGSGSSSLSLPGRLLELTSVNGDTNVENYDIQGDGFFLRYFEFGVPPVKADYYGLHMHVGGVIHNPNNVRLTTFKRGRTYEVSGLWGYYDVPNDVQEAARILIGLYADPDSEYRDRYLTSMTAADWRIQFNDGAFVQTGHVRADQLLAPYVLRRGWAVL